MYRMITEGEIEATVRLIKIHHIVFELYHLYYLVIILSMKIASSCTIILYYQ